jgi:type IV secretion system protein VirB10
VQKAPLGEADGEEATSGSGQERTKEGNTLFHQAVWSRPADARKVLYRDQIINAQLSQNINSDRPGAVVLLVTEDVQDIFGHGHVLIPQYSKFFASQDGQVKFGQKTVGLVVEDGRFPDGTAIEFPKGQVGDALGAAGVPGRVDNHIPEKIFGILATATLSVGSRVPFGNTTNYQQTLPQEFAQDASRSINQSGQELVRRMFDLPPTIHVEHGVPVTIQFKKNISFQTEPTTYRK